MSAPADASRRWIVRFSGRVQGVGFRYTAQNIALQYNVCGYVKNLPDGRVELVMEGAESTMEQIARRLAEKMASFIKSTTTESAAATGEFSEFAIRH